MGAIGRAVGEINVKFDVGAQLEELRGVVCGVGTAAPNWLKFGVRVVDSGTKRWCKLGGGPCDGWRDIDEFCKSAQLS